jgi:hypothetical protein
MSIEDSTTVMAISTALSFLALSLNAYLFQRQLKIQREQKEAMLQLV